MKNPIPAFPSRLGKGLIVLAMICVTIALASYANW